MDAWKEKKGRLDIWASQDNIVVFRDLIFLSKEFKGYMRTTNCISG